MVWAYIMVQLVDIVASRVKAAIFRLLFGLEPVELHLRELTRRSGLALGTVQQELKQLTGLGLVLARRDGNRLYYRANPAHPLHAELCGLVRKTDGWPAILGRALADPDVRVAFVFGSMAPGQAGAGSDVDLRVVGGVGLRRLTQLLTGVTEQLGRELNPHALAPEEFRERCSRRDHFLTAVLDSPILFVKGTRDELDAMVR